MMKRFLFVMLLALPLAAQPKLDVTGPSEIRRGETLQLDVTLADAANISGLQWDLTQPFGSPTMARGAAAETAEKELYCEPPRCLVVGMNSNLIADGVVGSYAVVIPDDAALGPVTLALSGVLAASPDANPVTLQPGAQLALQVRSWRWDLNDDGVVDGVDLLISVNQVLGVTACTTADLDNSGSCDLYDVLILVKHAVQ